MIGDALTMTEHLVDDRIATHGRDPRPYGALATTLCYIILFIAEPIPGRTERRYVVETDKIPWSGFIGQDKS